MEELFRSPIEIRGVLASPQLGQTPRGRALQSGLRDRNIPMEEVDERVFATAAETETPQGVLAIGVVPDWTLDGLSLTDPWRIVVLDGVQDPGNVGTIVRTAAALGAAATVALPGTVDLWNAKVVRSGMGSHFHHPSVSTAWDELDAFRRDHGVAVWAADASGEPLASLAPPARLALVLGNEGSGLSSLSRDRADRLVALPIATAVDSLNVAVAAAIILYELCR